MAQLNCPTCSSGMWMDQWGNISQDPQRSGSNVSLNMPPNGYPMQMNPLWMNPMGTWHGPSPGMMGMFPYPMGMPMSPANHSESQSRSHSRAGSPSPSIKSRRSHVSKTSKKYREETDEEADRNSVFSYADKSERKSVRDRAEKIRAKKEASAKAKRQEERRSVSQERNDKPIKNDNLERTSIANKQKNISSESEDYKTDSHKESETTNDEEEVKEIKTTQKEIKTNEEVTNVTETITDESEEVANTELPAVPDEEWECEHCTFVNSAGTRVCSICCKTPTTKIKIIKPPTKTTTSNKVSSGTNTQTKSFTKPSDVIQQKRNADMSSKFDKLNVNEEPVLNHINAAYEGLNNKMNDSKSPKKGRTLRKISFWPGTKFAPFYK